MIKGVSKREIPYVLEDDRASALHEQTVFWILPKTGHDNNRTLQRYAATSKDNRKGFREINVSKLDAADIAEFSSIVKKVENFQFPEDSNFYNNENKGIYKVIEDDEKLGEVARTLAADHLSEILEVANNISKLKEGEKKSSSSLSGSSSGEMS